MDSPRAAPSIDDYLRATTGAVPALISFFDEQHICRFANDHHAHWYGRTPEMLIGVHMREFLGEAAYVERLPHLDRVAAGEEVSFEAAVPHLDGGWREAAIRYVPRMGPNGFEGFHTLVIDLSRDHHRFHSVFDGTAVGFWEIDLTNMRAMLAKLAETVEDLSAHIAADVSVVRQALDVTPVLGLNAKASEMFGLERAAAIGRPLGNWCPDASLKAWNNNLLAYLAGEASYETETIMRREDGAGVEVLLSCAFPRRPEDQMIVIVGLVDISERVAKERALSRAQADLAHAARVATLGELTASIAHEVNQPLAAVLANGNAALRWLNRDEPNLDEVRAAIRRMMFEGGRASEIVARTRKMATKGGSEPTRFALAAMIEETVEITARQVSALGAHLSVTLDPALGFVFADRIQIQQVVINLIINAAQAMADLPPAALRRIEVVGRRAPSSVRLEVIDTGPGLTPEAQEKLFEAFYTTKMDGMGMGLSVARTIMEAHGGAIDAGTAPAGGAMFGLRLPTDELQT